jgi:uncharacterized membrane protein YeaQ/YmgE (transglycosylase-associated protein family)
MGIIADILIGILAGWVTGLIRRGHGYGLLGNLIVGVVGALVGGFVIGLVGFLAQGLLAHLLTATAGAVGLLYLVEVIRRRAG